MTIKIERKMPEKDENQNDNFNIDINPLIDNSTTTQNTFNQYNPLLTHLNSLNCYDTNTGKVYETQSSSQIQMTTETRASSQIQDETPIVSNKRKRKNDDDDYVEKENNDDDSQEDDHISGCNCSTGNCSSNFSHFFL